MHVSALERADACRTEPSAAVFGKPFGPPIGLAELGPQPVGPLEVVADELVELGEIRRSLIEAVGEALVQLGAESLRRRAVDRVLDDDVAEAERVLDGPEEAARDERSEMRC